MGFGSNFFGAATAALPLGAQIGVRGIENAQKQKEDDRANLIAKEKLGLLKKVDKRQAKLLQMKIEDDKLNNLTKSLARTSDLRERNNLIFQFRHTNADNERMIAATQVFDEFSIEQIKKLDDFNKIIELSNQGKKTFVQGAQAHMGRKALYTANSQDYPVEYIEYDRHFGLTDPVLNARNIEKQTADFKEAQKEAGRAQAALAFDTLSINLQYLKSVVNPMKSISPKKSSSRKKPTPHMLSLGAKPDADRAAIIDAVSMYRDGMTKSGQDSEAADTVIREVFSQHGVDLRDFPSVGVESLKTTEEKTEAKRPKESEADKAERIRAEDREKRQVRREERQVHEAAEKAKGRKINKAKNRSIIFAEMGVIKRKIREINPKGKELTLDKGLFDIKGNFSPKDLAELKQLADELSVLQEEYVANGGTLKGRVKQSTIKDPLTAVGYIGTLNNNKE